jgi:GTPase SAR1 family protein
MQAKSNMRGYVLNLDPAVMTLPFGANIDIRDTVRYKEVMKEYGLGPNGGILTSLNLFSTKFDEVHILYRSHMFGMVVLWFVICTGIALKCEFVQTYNHTVKLN